jgi:hypothetical protein
MTNIIQFPGPHQEEKYEMPSVDDMVGYFETAIKLGFHRPEGLDDFWQVIEKNYVERLHEMTEPAQAQKWEKILRNRIQEAIEKYKKQHQAEIMPFPFERIRKGLLRLAVKLSEGEFNKESQMLHSLLAQYAEPCPWCPVKRPEQEQNIVPAKVPGSHGMCPECFDIVRSEILEKKRQKEEFFKDLSTEKSKYGKVEAKPMD